MRRYRCDNCGYVNMGGLRAVLDGEWRHVCYDSAACAARALADFHRNTDYAEQDEDGQLSIGVTGEQRAIPGLAAPRREHPTFDMGA